jgi:hypothetical protein
LNNHSDNLRYATHAENQYNQQLRIDNTSGHKGICFREKRNKWVAKIQIDGITINLGYFDNKEDAIQARITRANAAFGIYTNACERI